MKLMELDKGMLSLLVQHNQIPKWYVSCLLNLVVDLSVFLMFVKKRIKSTTLFIVIFLTSVEIMEGLGNEQSGELCRCENEKNYQAVEVKWEMQQRVDQGRGKRRRGCHI